MGWADPGTDLQLRIIELDRNIVTDPYQIPERILGDDSQNPITEDMEETGHFDVDRPYVQSRIHSDYDSAESIADSDLGDGELRTFAGLTAVCIWVKRKLWFFSKTHSFRETRGKNNTEERGKCKSCSS